MIANAKYEQVDSAGGQEERAGSGRGGNRDLPRHGNKASKNVLSLLRRDDVNGGRGNVQVWVALTGPITP